MPTGRFSIVSHIVPYAALHNLQTVCGEPQGMGIDPPNQPLLCYSAAVVLVGVAKN